MVEFSLSTEQKQLQQLAHEFAEKEIRPQAAHYDETGEWPEAILRKAWELGLVNSHIPPSCGGMGLSSLDGCLVEEELGWGCTGISTAICANSLAQMPVILAGNEQQHRKWLSPFVEAPLVCSYAVTEPGAGSDVANIQTVAVKKGDKYIVNGQKIWITGAGHADWYFVLVKTDKEAGYKGLSALIIPRSLAGVKVGKKENNMGQRASDTRSLTFEDVEVPVENLIGREGDGFLIAMKTFDYTRPMVAATAIGLARAAMEHAIEYATVRKAFGRPIWQHEGVGFMIADMATEIEAGRLLVWKSAAELDAKRRNTIYAAHAKRFMADTGMKVAVDAVQVFGGNGFNKEYPVEKLMRDAKIFQIYEGTSQIQRMIIARELFVA